MAHPLAPPYNFSPQVRALLERAGWYPGRVAAPPVRLPASLSYPSQVLTLLQEFGGLRVEYTGIRFEPADADDEMVEVYSEKLGRTLYPIGVSLDWWDICVDLHGSVYMRGNWLALAGRTFVEGISFVLTKMSAGLQLNEDDMTWGPDRQVITWPNLPPTS